jgi:BirA family biotin operon repressor/biotin-[acetyl-CoA-carboxylase] ligase
MLTIHLPEIDSTNSYLLQQLASGADYPDGTVVFTTCQTHGRGQVNNSWESEPGQNLAFSLLLKPEFLPITMNFALSELTALAIAETLDELVEGFSIKWPNDIYHDDRKAVGILIENRLSGHSITHSVIGVGINLNQREFRSNAPNPVSVAQLRAEQGLPDLRIEPERVLHDTLTRLMGYYTALRAAALTAADLTASAAYRELHSRYVAKLYRRTGLHPYQDTDSGETFEARTFDVEPCGALRLLTAAGEMRRYMFKEVKFRLPCGVVKE